MFFLRSRWSRYKPFKWRVETNFVRTSVIWASNYCVYMLIISFKGWRRVWTSSHELLLMNFESSEVAKLRLIHLILFFWSFLLLVFIFEFADDVVIVIVNHQSKTRYYYKPCQYKYQCHKHPIVLIFLNVDFVLGWFLERFRYLMNQTILQEKYRLNWYRKNSRKGCIKWIRCAMNFTFFYLIRNRS